MALAATSFRHACSSLPAVVCVALIAILAIPESVGALASCPPGVPGYDDAHSTPGGLVCVPRGDAAFAKSVVSFKPGTYTLNTDCPNAGPTAGGQKFSPGHPTKPANQNGTAVGALGKPDVPFASFNGHPIVRWNNDASIGGGESSS